MYHEPWVGPGLDKSACLIAAGLSPSFYKKDMNDAGNDVKGMTTNLQLRWAKRERRQFIDGLLGRRRVLASLGVASVNVV